MRRPERGENADPNERHRRSEPGDGEDKDDKTGDKQGERIELSVAQIAGAGVATLTAATAASYLNVYGTVIGTAVMAVLSTSAAPVIQHWITRSGKQAKELADKAKQPQARNLVERPEPAIEHGEEFPFESPEDATRTMALPTLGQNLPGQTLAHGFGNPADPARPHDPITDEATELPSPPPHEDPGLARNESEDDKTRPEHGRRAALIPAGVVFVLVMLVVLVFELLTGRSLTAWTQGQEEPTSPSLLGGHSAPAQPDEDEAPLEPEGERAPGDPRPGSGPWSDTEEPVDPGTVPGDQETDAPTSPTVPTEPPAEGPDTERPGEQTDPGAGDGTQGEGAPQDGAPQSGVQGDPQGEPAPLG